MRKFKIAGLFLSGFPDFDENFVLGDLHHIQRINNWKNDEIGSYEVFTRDLNTSFSVGSSIYPKLASDLDVIEITRQYATIFQWISLFRFQYIDHHHFNDSGRGHKYVYCLIGFDFRTLDYDWLI